MVVVNMRLLIITQKIDDDDAMLGFMHSWVTEFKGRVDSFVGS